MINLDHIILRVRNIARSVDFYKNIVGLTHAGSANPFEVMRVNSSLNIDLLEDTPKESSHLAFALDKTGFNALHGRLVAANIPIGGGVFARDGRISENEFGAQGLAKAFYFYDPDQHNLEARLYEK